ncbi:STOREKEEPER protein-like isoform X2 [Salvia hispanica]|nr:STOREKEEPER protein-like isoform X2 [Salvia hispanica]
MKKKTIWPPRVFSDEDEILVLKRLADFWGDGKNCKWTKFHRFVKDDLSKPYTRHQVAEKIRRLNNKFHRYGADPDLSTPHKSAVYELSRALWKDEVKKRKRKRKEKKIGLDEFECKYPYLCASFKMPGCPVVYLDELVLIGREKAGQLEKQWREVYAQQLRLQ